MNYIFIGGTNRGFSVLKALIGLNHLPDYVVILKEDEHEEVKYSGDISDFTKKHSIPYSIRKKLGKEDVDIIQEKKRDFAIICGWRTIIPYHLNNYFKLGMVAAHDSLLPRYRGFAPINWAIINGEKTVGVTLFLINDGVVDSGKIISQKKVSVDKDDFALDVFRKVTDATVSAFIELTKDYQNNNIKLKKQDEKKATYTCKRSPEDGKINWNDSAGNIYNFIRALAPPYPGAFCFFNNHKYIITKAQIGTLSSRNYVQYIPGRVILICDKGVEVMCNKGSIMIQEWQNEMTKVSENPNSVVKSITLTLE
jgi:methionyl-tRNA formyltransferase